MPQETISTFFRAKRFVNFIRYRHFSKMGGEGGRFARRLRDEDVKIVCGMEGLIEVATEPQTEILVTAVVGMLGLPARR